MPQAMPAGFVPDGFEPDAPISSKGGTEPGTYAGGFFQSLGKTAKDTASNAVTGFTRAMDPREWINAENVNNSAAGKWSGKPPVDLTALAKSMTTPEGGGQAIGGLAAFLAAGRVPAVTSAAAKIPLRAPAAKALEFASEVLNNPAAGFVSPRAPHAGQMLGKVADVLKPGRGGPTAEGFDRYGGMGPSNYTPGDITPPSPSSAMPIIETPSGGLVGRDAATGRFTKTGPAPAQPAKPGTVGDMLADPREPAVLSYAGPERRVSGPAARQAWDDQTHARMLQQLGGRGKPPTAAELELAQKLGQPGDAEMQMAISNRNAGTRWQPTPPSSSVRVPVSLNDAMAAAVRKVKK